MFSRANCTNDPFAAVGWTILYLLLTFLDLLTYCSLFRFLFAPPGLPAPSGRRAGGGEAAPAAGTGPVRSISRKDIPLYRTVVVYFADFNHESSGLSGLRVELTAGAHSLIR
eukprot:3579643-Pyramimonas_sp.AAC.1